MLENCRMAVKPLRMSPTQRGDTNYAPCRHCRGNRGAPKDNSRKGGEHLRTVSLRKNDFGLWALLEDFPEVDYGGVVHTALVP
jgi:hypothetical protein